MQLPTWISRVLAVVLLLAVLMVSYLFIVPPLMANYSDTRNAVDQSTTMLTRYQSLAVKRPALELQIEELKGRRTSREIYLAGATDALAAAELQNRVKSIIENQSGSLRSIQPVPGTDDGAFQRVMIRVQMSAAIGAVYRILYDLESAKPFLFIDNMEIGNRKSRRRKDTNSEDPALLVRFDLYGYRQGAAQ